MTLGTLHIDGPSGPAIPPELLPKLEEIIGLCCYGVACQSVEYCTCWEPVYDLEQIEELALDAPTDVQLRCCVDCAYRPDSPEWADEWKREQLLDLPNGGGTFWCHQGIRKPVEWRHPSGLVLPAGVGDYQPPIVTNRPYRADGAPAPICAGWAARVSAQQLERVLARLAA